MTFQSLLRWGADQLLGVAGADSRLESEWLLCEAFGLNRVQLLSKLSDSVSSNRSHRCYLKWIERRQRHEPIAYILGHAEFMGNRYRILPGVLIPRPETEHLIEVAQQHFSGGVILELGFGSGVISLELARRFPEAPILAWDVSKKAHQVAQLNVQEHCVANVQFFLGDFFKANSIWGPFLNTSTPVLLLSNPPYIQRRDISLLDRQIQDFEPVAALDGGVTGLAIYKRLFREFAGVVNLTMILEVGQGQRVELDKLLQRLGYLNWSWTSDLSGIDRVLLVKSAAASSVGAPA